MPPLVTAKAARPAKAAPHFLAGGGDMGALLRSHNWGRSSLGSPAQWPATLQVAVRIMLLSPQPMCIWWGERYVVLYNDPFMELLGDGHPDAVGAPASQVWADEWGRFEPRAGHLMQARQNDDEETLSLSGQLVTFARSVIPGGDRETAGIVWVARAPDRAQRAVPGAAADSSLQRHAEDYFRHMADHAPVMIWVNGLEGCEFVNREYLRFLGRTMDDVKGTGWLRFLHTDDAAGYVAQYAEALENRAPFEGTMRFRRADGEYRWIQSSGVPRLRSDGALLGYIGCSWDITELRRYADELREADRRKDTFLATLAHELRNPLAPLRHGLQIMQLAEGDATAVAQARSMMKRQLQHMVRLIDDLLDVSRITLGKLELQRQPIEIGEVVRSAVETSRPHISDATQRLQMTLPSAPLWVQGDAVRLAQVFANLLNNASKFTASGGRITLAIERDDQQVVIRVSDTGVGIAPDKLKEVFDIFTQVESGGTQDGLGVGLSIARQLIELHGGRLEGHSRGRGQGSEFIVRLPMANPPVSAAAKPETHNVAEAGDQPLRILVADDNVDSADSLAEVLRMLGHDVRVAHDGQEAVDVARGFQPDVALLDIGMPKLNGYDSCRKIREEPWGRNVTMVALTGWGQTQHRERSRSAGFDHHLVKPVELADLQAVFRTHGNPRQ